ARNSPSHGGAGGQPARLKQIEPAFNTTASRLSPEGCRGRALCSQRFDFLAFFFFFLPAFLAAFLTAFLAEFFAAAFLSAFLAFFGGAFLAAFFFFFLTAGLAAIGAGLALGIAAVVVSATGFSSSMWSPRVCRSPNDSRIRRCVKRMPRRASGSRGHCNFAGPDAYYKGIRREALEAVVNRYVVLYLATLIVLIPIDFLFLGVVAKGFFTSEVGDMLGEIRPLPAILFYLLYVGGILIFVSGPISATWQTTLL